MIKTLRDCLADAEKAGVALGHFNVSNLEGVHAIVRAGESLKVPVVIGVSEGERDYVGVAEIAALVKTLRQKTSIPIFLNADHTHSFEAAKAAIDAGFDSVTADGSKLSIEENIAYVRECVAYAKASGRDVIIEGELGYIGTSSEVHTEVPHDISFDEDALTSPDVASRFVRESGVDMLAPAVGNMHGMVGIGKDPSLRIDRIESISQTTGIPLVLHGASGNSDEDVRRAIASGCRMVHVNTELRTAFRTALEKSLSENPSEVAVYKYTQPAQEAMKKVVLEKLTLFNNITL